MFYFGNLLCFMKIKFIKINRGIFLHQKRYVEDVLKVFHTSNCNEAITSMEFGEKTSKDLNEEPIGATLYKQIIGFYRYLCNTILELCHIKVVLPL